MNKLLTLEKNVSDMKSCNIYRFPVYNIYSATMKT